MESDERQDSENGPYSQKKINKICLLLTIATIPMGYLISTNVFISDFMPFYCLNDTEISNLSHHKDKETNRYTSGYEFYDGRAHFAPIDYMTENQKNKYAQLEKQTSETECEKKAQSHDNGLDMNDTCSMVFFNKEGVNTGQRTLRISFNLICDRAYLLPTTTTAGFLGNAIGSLVGGRLSDRFGRRPLYLISLFLQILFCGVTAIAPNVYIYILGIFWAVFCQMISYQVGMVIMTELTIDVKKRTIWQCMYGLIFSIGVVMLPVSAYYFPDWRQIMWIATLSRFIAIPYYWFIPESWRWRHNRDSLLAATADRKVELQKLKEDRSSSKIVRKSTTVDETGFTAIFNHPEARRRLLLVCCAWMLQTYSYYSMNINSTNISSDHIYQNSILTAFVDIPAAILSIYLVKFFGKRGSFKISQIASFIILAIGLLWKNIETLDTNWPFIFEWAMIIGKMVLCNLTNIIWIYVQDLFPTSIRNTSVGIAAFSSQMGSCISPYIVELGRGKPNVLYGSCVMVCFINYIVVMFLPETDQDHLPETLDDI